MTIKKMLTSVLMAVILGLITKAPTYIAILYFMLFSLWDKLNEKRS